MPDDIRELIISLHEVFGKGAIDHRDFSFMYGCDTIYYAEHVADINIFRNEAKSLWYLQCKSNNTITRLRDGRLQSKWHPLWNIVFRDEPTAALAKLILL